MFDTENLISLLENEFEAHPWTYLRLAEVHYALEDIAAGSIFPELMSLCEAHLVEAFLGKPLNIKIDTIISFLSSAPRLKHGAFREEQEIRIISIPYPPNLTAKARQELGIKDDRPEKDIRLRGDDIPYITLFDRQKSRLPIRRLIVGPSRNQDDNFRAAHSIVGTKFPIRRSKTPFIG